MNEQNFCSECERPISPDNCHTFEGALMSWRDFVLKVDGEKMPELVSYLKVRQLYVNEPAEVADQEV